MLSVFLSIIYLKYMFYNLFDHAFLETILLKVYDKYYDTYPILKSILMNWQHSFNN